jgi:hypothetical protein
MKKINIKKHLISLGIISLLTIPIIYIISPIIRIYTNNIGYYSMNLDYYIENIKLNWKGLEVNNNIISYGLNNYIYTFKLIAISYILIALFVYVRNIRLNNRIEKYIQTKK